MGYPLKEDLVPHCYKPFMHIHKEAVLKNSLMCLLLEVEGNIKHPISSLLLLCKYSVCCPVGIS